MGMSQLQLGYLIGIMDGEGSITIAKKRTHRQRDKYYKKYVIYVPHVVLTNTNEEMLRYCQKLYELEGIEAKLYQRKLVPKGKIREGNKIRIINRRKPVWHLEISKRREAIRALKLMIPHLIEKKQAAKLVLEFVESREISVEEKKKHFGHPSYTEREKEIYNEVKNLTMRLGKGVIRNG